MSSNLVLINGFVQNYPWGKPASRSLIGSLVPPETIKDPSQPTAEIWYGTHISGESQVYLKNDKTASVPLSSVIGHQLPFLTKVLSVEKPLSIQVHPDAETAVELHRTRPDLYPDANGKPEMILAFTDFWLLYGFQQPQAILNNLQELYPETKVDGELTMEKMKILFADLLLHEEEYKKQGLLQRLYDDLNRRYSRGDADIRDHKCMRYWMREVMQTFPDDYGIMCLAFMNLLHIEPGQAFYVAPGELHSYLFGECLEVQGNSNNVCRAGLTGKPKDVENLLKILKVSDIPPLIDNGKIMDRNSVVYESPCKSIAIEYVCTSLPYPLRPVNSESIILVLNGKGDIRVDAKQEDDYVETPQTEDSPRIVHLSPTKKNRKSYTIGRGGACWLPENRACWIATNNCQIMLVRTFTAT